MNHKQEPPKSEKSQSKFGFAFDVCFVLVLCFVIIMVSISLTSGMQFGPTETGYHINPGLMIGSLGAVAVLLVFIVKKSSGDLRKMLREVESSEEEEQK